MPKPAAALFALLLSSPALAGTPAEPEPIKVVEDSLAVPPGLDATAALAVAEDLPALFQIYQPVVPKVPGVSLDLTKEVVSTDAPVVLALPVKGGAFGRPIAEEAVVTATTQPLVCADGADGLGITLSFAGSSRNVERRVDRIDISACPRLDEDGNLFIDAQGAMFAGDLPKDPDLNALEESIGAKALQTAFLKQVPAVFDAVEEAWTVKRPPIAL